MTKWSDEIAIGRAFELRSRSKRYRPTCILIIDDSDRRHDRWCVQVDERGTSPGFGHYARTNPRTNIYQFRRREDFTSTKIARRRPDLERFDADDLAFIKYGLHLKFGGRLGREHYDGYGEIDYLPDVVPGIIWTVFWTRDERSWIPFDWDWRDSLKVLLSGAWHFEQSASPSWRKGFIHAWVTAHRGPRLRAVEHFLRRQYPDIERQEVTIARWHDWATLWTHTWHVGNPGPAFTGRWKRVTTPTGGWSSYSSGCCG